MAAWWRMIGSASAWPISQVSLSNGPVLPKPPPWGQPIPPDWALKFSATKKILPPAGRWIVASRPPCRRRNAIVSMSAGGTRCRVFSQRVYTFGACRALTVFVRARKVQHMGRAVLGQVVIIEGEHNARRKPDSLARLKQAARKLFVERGFDATRPQDIAREAGLGHGTFYLHFADKRACFLSFVQEARQELDEQLHARLVPGAGLEQRITAMFGTIAEYAESHPGVLRAAMTDGRVIDAE